MTKIFGCCLGVGLALSMSAAAAHSAPDEEVTKDAKGRVTSRRTTNTDKSGHRSSFQYGSDSTQPLVVVEEDFDQLDRVTKRVEQRFDAPGRIKEKLDVRIDAAGKQTGTRTRYSYDAAGRRFEHVTPVD